MSFQCDRQRLSVLAGAVVIVILLLIGRLGYLQVVEGKYYSGLADGNRIRLIPAVAPRGLFYDRNGVLMVSNRPGFNVSLVQLAGPVPKEEIQKLAVILGIKPEEIAAKIAKHTGFDPLHIKMDVGPGVIAKIEERKSEFPNVVIGAQPIRNYIYNELAVHVFGYVSEIDDNELKKLKSKGYKSGDIIGKAGLERVYDEELRGVDGGGQVEVDAMGKPVQTLGRKEPVPGHNLILTIDQKIQQAAEKAIDEQLAYLQAQSPYRNAKAAAAVVLDPRTGEVLALASRPAFNPNLFAQGISSKDWKAINENPFDPMLDRAIAGKYPPGSTFKPITGAAALELGKVTPEEKIFDSGRHWLIDKRNAEGEALGWIDFRTALAKSDNVYFYEMGNRVGIDNLEKYARMFGLGEPTGIHLPGEAAGLVASRAYKKRVYKEDWYLSETFDAAIGQGFQLVTPLQMAVVMSEIANGGHRYRPYLVSRIVAVDGTVVKAFAPEETGRLEVSEKTMNLIRESLRDVAQGGGTASSFFSNFPISIAGKTGTAENPHGSDHGWFVCYAPYDNPTVAVAVIVEQGGFGASSAVPIGKKILEAVFHLTPPAANAG